MSVNRYAPGDFILVKGTAWYSHCIDFGEWLRYGKRPFHEYSHAAMIVGANGDLVEALSNGVDKTHISKYPISQYTMFDVTTVCSTASDRQRVVNFALNCVGMRYDYLDILSISISLLTGTKLSVSTSNHLICSGLVARALERSTAIFPRPSQQMMPADLAVYFS